MAKQHIVSKLVHYMSRGYIQKTNLRRKKNKRIRRISEQYEVC